MISLSIATEILFSSFFSGLVLVYLCLRGLRGLNIVDRPSKRRSHKVVTPRGAGISYCLITTIFLYLLELNLAQELVYSTSLLPIFVVLSVVTFIDDIRHMPILLRLILHFTCVYMFATEFVWPKMLFQGYVYEGFDNLLVLICFTTYINIYNFMDGIDGLSAGESVFISVGILTHCYMAPSSAPHLFLLESVSLITIGWSLAFLVFNWHPAKIFLGDVGSIAMGFLLGGCLLLISLEGIEHLLFCIIISFYYLADGGITILIRLFKGEKIWQPHLQHFFQQALKRGATPSEVTRSILMCNFVLWILAMCSLSFPIISFVFASLFVALTLRRMTA